MRVQVHAADLGGCGHYRLLWPAAALEVADPSLELEVLTPDDGIAESFRGRADIPATVAKHGPDTLDRMARYDLDPRAVVIGELEEVPDVDVVVLQRPLTAHLVDVVRILQRHGLTVVVEVDDDFDTIHPRNIAHPTVDPRLDAFRNREHLTAACELADIVVVTTPALAARYGSHGRVRIVPNYVPVRYLHVLPRDREPGDVEVRVGWSGSLDTHPGDLEETGGTVGAVLRERGLKFHHIGPPQQERIRRALGLHIDTLYATTGEWLPLLKYPVAMAMVDVGLVPLALSPFNEAKSWLKGLEFASVGVPFIASPTGPYRQLHDDHGIGILAASPRDWRRELSRLLDDADYRYELGADYRRRARELTIENHITEWADAWQDAMVEAANRKSPTP